MLRPDPFVVIESVEERKKCADKLVGMWLMRDVRVVFRTAPASDRTIVLENWGSRKIPVEFRTREWILSRFSFKHGLEMPTVFSGPGIHYFYGTTILNFSSQPSAEEFLKTWSGFLKTRFFPQVRNLPCPPWSSERRAGRCCYGLPQATRGICRRQNRELRISGPVHRSCTYAHFASGC